MEIKLFFNTLNFTRDYTDKVEKNNRYKKHRRLYRKIEKSKGK